MRRRRPAEPEAAVPSGSELKGEPLPEDYLSPLWALADGAWPSPHATPQLVAWSREHAPAFVLTDEQARANRDRRTAHAAARLAARGQS
jgi:hypothetical protein